MQAKLLPGGLHFFLKLADQAFIIRLKDHQRLEDF